MLKRIDSAQMGQSQKGWLTSWFHFSFAEYDNPQNVQYGVLRVINDDWIQPQNGFAPHSHENMEIITYVVEGELTHGDSMGNQRTLGRGDVQYMSAGTGVVHSEYNWGSIPLRLLQIWILPEAEGYEPRYSDYRFSWRERLNGWFHMVSGEDGAAPISIHQQVDIYVTDLLEGESISLPVPEDKQVYLVLMEGGCSVNGVDLWQRDGLEAADENLEIIAGERAHMLAFVMDKV